MKKLFFTLFALFSVAASQAQVMYEEDGALMTSWTRFNDSIAKSRIQNHLIGFRTYVFRPDSNVISGYLSTEFKYDANGNIAEYKTLNRYGKIKSRFIEEWNAQHKYLGFTSYKRNGKFNYRTTYVYNSAGDEVEWKTYRHKIDKMDGHGFMTYDEKHNMTECTYLYKNDKKIGYRIVYSYYPDGSKKQTIDYDGKGKIVYKWDYDCSAVGKLVSNKLKDTSKLCIRFETDKNGNQIKIKEEFLKDGDIVRIITKYDANEYMLEQIKYNKKGKSIYHIAYSYNAGHHLAESREYKNNDTQIKSRKVYFYNVEGKASHMIEYKTDNKPKLIEKYEYVRG